MQLHLKLLTWAAACLIIPIMAKAEMPAVSGNEICKTCHVAYEEHKNRPYHNDCAACHTAEKKHLTDGGKGNVLSPDSGQCESCHASKDKRQINWHLGEHKQAGVACRDCHGIHSPKVKQINVGAFKMDKNSLLCSSCHQDVMAKLNMPSHHPVKEGGLSCISCHDPHSSKKTTLASKNTQCAKCHQAITGPKPFEHAPVVEDCTICHDPHGSPNRRLQQHAQPIQCLQCHSLALNRHAVSAGIPGERGRISGAVLRNCTNCHSAVHGSHQNPRLTH
jgi:DmsE family decaheme c-type cytochrome